MGGEGVGVGVGAGVGAGVGVGVGAGVGAGVGVGVGDSPTESGLGESGLKGAASGTVSWGGDSLGEDASFKTWLCTSQYKIEIAKRMPKTI